MKMPPNLIKLMQRLNISKLDIKIIIDLISKGNSLNDVSTHFLYVYDRKLSNSAIRKVFQLSGKNAKTLNKKYDTWVKDIKDKIKIMETDEIHQGSDGIVIAMADKTSTYLLAFEQIKNKSIEVISKIMRNNLHKFGNIKIMLTDGLPAYKKAVQGSFKEVIHIMCHVHAYRAMRRELEPYLFRCSEAYKKLKKARYRVEFCSNRIKKQKKSRYYYETKLHRKERERDEYYEQAGIQKYAKKTE